MESAGGSGRGRVRGGVRRLAVFAACCARLLHASTHLTPPSLHPTLPHPLVSAWSMRLRRIPSSCSESCTTPPASSVMRWLQKWRRSRRTRSFELYPHPLPATTTTPFPPQPTPPPLPAPHFHKQLSGSRHASRKQKGLVNPPSPRTPPIHPHLYSRPRPRSRATTSSSKMWPTWLWARVGGKPRRRAIQMAGSGRRVRWWV